jgi:hypothetical protein
MINLTNALVDDIEAALTTGIDHVTTLECVRGVVDDAPDLDDIIESIMPDEIIPVGTQREIEKAALELMVAARAFPEDASGDADMISDIVNKIEDTVREVLQERMLALEKQLKDTQKWFTDLSNSVPDDIEDGDGRVLERLQRERLGVTYETPNNGDPEFNALFKLDKDDCYRWCGKTIGPGVTHQMMLDLNQERRQNICK